jgi:hypothetical protein
MRWLVACCLLSSVFAHAASVLLVPVDEKARALAEELIEPFAAENLTVKTAGPGSPAVTCLKDKAQKVDCLTALAGKAKVIAVFVVSGALRGPRGVLTLELISEGRSLKTEATAVQRGKVKAQMRAPVDRLLQLVPEHAQSKPVEQPTVTVTVTQSTPPPEPAPRPPRDAPVQQPELAPAPAPADPLALKTPAPKAAKPNAGAWVMTGLAVAAAGTAVAFAGLGLAARNQLEAAPGGVSPLSYSEAQALQQQSNRDFTIALGAGLGAGVSGVVAALLWGVE